MASYHRQNLHASKKKISLSYVIREKEERFHRAGVNSLQYDPLLDRLYSAGRDSIIRIWSFSNSATPSRMDVSNYTNGYDRQQQHHKENYFIQSMEHHTDWVNDIILCGDGRNLISVSNDTTIKVWNAHQGFCLSTLRSHKDYARCLAYAKDRGVVASAGFDQMIYLWDIQALTTLTATKNTVTTKPLDGSKNSIYSLAINQSGTLVASGSTEKVIRLWDPRSRQKLLKLRGHTDNVRSLLFSKDGSMLLSAGSDGTIRLWSIAQQRCISIIRVHDGGVWTLQTNDSFSTVYSGGKDCKVYMTDLKNTSDSRLLCQEQYPILKMLLVDRDHSNAEACNVGSKQSIWVSTTDSEIKNWPISITDSNDVNRHEFLDQGSTLDDNSKLVQNREPSLIIRGNPAVIKYHILNDKRHILTQESDHSIALYDVLSARKVQNLYPAGTEIKAGQLYEEEIKKRFKLVYVPNWFTVDLKIGLLCIHLDESECLSAWVSARDYGFIPQMEGHDPKVNLGCLMLQALLEYWPPTFEGYDNDLKNPQQDIISESSTVDEYNSLQYVSRSNQSSFRQRNFMMSERGQLDAHRIGNQYFSISSHTPIIISEGNQTILRFLAQDACNENEDLFIQEIIPSWISDIVISKCQPKFTKIPFFLLPHSDSGIKSLRKERLSASDMLQMRKVIEHVCEKMLCNISDDTGGSSLAQDSNHRGSEQSNELKTYTIDKVELYCNDQKLDDHLDLRTVKHYIWKSGGDLVLHYMPLK